MKLSSQGRHEGWARFDLALPSDARATQRREVS